jgi:hypothetical protein
MKHLLTSGFHNVDTYKTPPEHVKPIVGSENQLRAARLFGATDFGLARGGANT